MKLREMQHPVHTHEVEGLIPTLKSSAGRPSLPGAGTLKGR